MGSNPIDRGKAGSKYHRVTAATRSNSSVRVGSAAHLSRVEGVGEFLAAEIGQVDVVDGLVSKEQIWGLVSSF